MVAELVRVTGKTLVIGFPTGLGASRQDADLSQLYREVRGEALAFFDEHLEHGLPEIDTVVARIRAAMVAEKRHARIEVHGDMNLRVRHTLMTAWIRRSAFDKLLWIVALASLPIVSRMNRGPCYRAIVVVRFAE